MSTRPETSAASAAEGTVAQELETDTEAGMGSAADFASAESREILNLLNDTQGGSCCGGSCCSD